MSRSEVARNILIMACVCGHAIKEHGNDPKYPGSTACSVCGCVAYDVDEDVLFKEMTAEADRKRAMEVEPAAPPTRKKAKVKSKAKRVS